VRAYICATQDERRNPKSLAQWHMTLLGETPEGERTEFNYCRALHDLPIGAIDTDAVHSVLELIWREKFETASRLRGRIEKVIDYAVVRRGPATSGPITRTPRAGKGGSSMHLGPTARFARFDTMPRWPTRSPRLHVEAPDSRRLGGAVPGCPSNSLQMSARSRPCDW
jgi:hypothetical protein